MTAVRRAPRATAQRRDERGETPQTAAEIDPRQRSAQHMQQTIGNRATARALARTTAPTRGGDQATVVAADHPSEREAERRAQRALRGPGRGAGAGARPLAQLPAGRARGGGRPLGAGVRAAMEGAFATDLGGVRVHDDARADGLSRSIHALAFTTGRDIFFRRGAYAPDRAGGQHLLAHELAHVVQPAPGSQIHRYTIVDSADADDPIQVQWSDDHTFVHQAKGSQEQDFLADPQADVLQANIVTHTGADGLRLKVSQNSELAIEALADNDTQEAKAFYATADQIEDSNAQLAEVDSAFRLVAQTGETLTIACADADARELVKVLPQNTVTPKDNVRRPNKDNDETEVTEGLDMLARQQCIDIAATVMGPAQDAALLDTVMELDDADDGYVVLRRLLRENAPVGVGMDAKSQVGTVRSFATTLQEIADASADAAVIVGQLRPLYLELSECLRAGAAPSAGLQGLLLAHIAADSPDALPRLAKLAVLAPEGPAAQFDSLLKEVHPIARQYAGYRMLQELDGTQGGADFARSSGLDEHARPEVGEAFKIRFLNRSDTDWNYHWAGVVARDGDDAVTLENSTREARTDMKYQDPRWAFKMYGPAEQSFHSTYRTATHALTASYSMKPTVDAPPQQQDTELSRSRGFARRLAVMRRTLIRDSGARTNASYLQIVALLNECATLAIDAAVDPDAYDTLVDRADAITEAYAAARSTKWGSKDARNAALAQMHTSLKALKFEAYVAFATS